MSCVTEAKQSNGSGKVRDRRPSLAMAMEPRGRDRTAKDQDRPSVPPGCARSSSAAPSPGSASGSPASPAGCRTCAVDATCAGQRMHGLGDRASSRRVSSLSVHQPADRPTTIIQAIACHCRRSYSYHTLPSFLPSLHTHRPRLGFSFPARIFRAVDLPVPFCPTRPSTCPGRGIGSLDTWDFV